MTGFQHFFRLLSPMARFFIPSTPQAGIPTFPIPTSLPSFERQILIMPIYANLTLGPDRKICPMILKPFDCDFQVCCENLSRIRLGWQLHYALILHLCLLFFVLLAICFSLLFCLSVFLPSIGMYVYAPLRLCSRFEISRLVLFPFVPVPILSVFLPSPFPFPSNFCFSFLPPLTNRRRLSLSFYPSTTSLTVPILALSQKP